jgi:hypothetical protein
MLLIAVAFALPISASAALAGTAAAASPKAKSSGVVCTSLKAKITGKNGTASGCSDTKNTGGSGKFPIAALTSGSGTITWNGTGTSTITDSFTAVSPGTCPTGDSEYQVNGTITGGTGAAAKSIVTGWTLSTTVCVNGSNGKIALLAGTDVLINATA